MPSLPKILMGVIYEKGILFIALVFFGCHYVCLWVFPLF